MTPERIAELEKKYDSRIYGGDVASDVGEILAVLKLTQARLAAKCAEITKIRLTLSSYQRQAEILATELDRLDSEEPYPPTSPGPLARCGSPRAAQ